jgi:hypothetical protein
MAAPATLPIPVAELSETTLDGTGVFDVLMRANKAHLEAEYAKGRIKGAEYATVYLGSLEAVLRASLDFLLQKAKASAELDVLLATKCKLEAEFDLLVLEKLKVTAETALLNQKTITEQAQVTALGVDENSVIGKQKALYTAQTNGFARDAEQKAAKLLSDTWAVRRTTDEATVATDTGATPNYLGDLTIGRAITKMLQGVGA